MSRLIIILALLARKNKYFRIIKFRNKKNRISEKKYFLNINFNFIQTLTLFAILYYHTYNIFWNPPLYFFNKC